MYRLASQAIDTESTLGGDAAWLSLSSSRLPRPPHRGPLEIAVALSNRPRLGRPNFLVRLLATKLSVDEAP